MDFYDDKSPQFFVQLCYKQYNAYQFELRFFDSHNNVISTPIYCNINDINTIEIRVRRDTLTVIDVFVNCRKYQVVTDTHMGRGIVNRFNFYCRYASELETCISHIIYSDEDENGIGNERICMLKTDCTQKVIHNGDSVHFYVNNYDFETLYKNLPKYKEVTGIGLLDYIVNTDDTNATVTEQFGKYTFPNYIVNANTDKYNINYLQSTQMAKQDGMEKQLAQSILKQQPYKYDDKNGFDIKFTAKAEETSIPIKPEQTEPNKEEIVNSSNVVQDFIGNQSFIKTSAQTHSKTIVPKIINPQLEVPHANQQSSQSINPQPKIQQQSNQTSQHSNLTATQLQNNEICINMTKNYIDEQIH